MISVAAIAAGVRRRVRAANTPRPAGWTVFFLAATTANILTGFLLPFERFLPSHAVGVVSLKGLPATLFTRYGRRLAGRWRPTFVVTARGRRSRERRAPPTCSASVRPI